MVPLLAALVYRSRPQVSEVAGVLVATAGLGLMTLRGAVGSISRGDLLTFLCAVGFAAHIVTLGHFSERMSFELLSVAQVAPPRCCRGRCSGGWRPPASVGVPPWSAPYW